MFEKEIESLVILYPIITEFLPLLEKSLSEEKYFHSIGVMITSREIMVSQFTQNSNAENSYAKNSSDNAQSKLVEKTVIAGLLHDCAKNLSLQDMLQVADTYGITRNEAGEMSRSLLHAPVGVFVAQRDYKIRDVEILDAIRYHTTGRADMTLLEKIVYMADILEPTREITNDINHDDRISILGQAKCQLNKTILSELEKGINIVLSSGKFLHLNTVSARNFLLAN